MQDFDRRIAFPVSLASRVGVWCVALLLPVLAGSYIGCSEDQATEQPRDESPSIPFRKDGTLTFTRADGTPITTIDIEIAESDSAQARGLMQRDELPEDAGMLFVYPGAAPRSFWMANTRIPLDIIFVGADREIMRIAKYVRPRSPESIPSRYPAQYVVEVNAGFADTYGLSETDRIEWSREAAPSP